MRKSAAAPRTVCSTRQARLILVGLQQRNCDYPGEGEYGEVEI